MPMPQKQVPPKPCAACGAMMTRKRWANGKLEATLHFDRRMFCDRTCMARGFEARPKTETPSWSTAHHHARRICPPATCARCPLPGIDVHHKDGDWRNNAPENLERLCRACHQKTHGTHRGTQQAQAAARRRAAMAL